MEEILGREEEITTLNKLLRSEEAQFLAVYGRRRVGKTYLIDRYFRTRSLYFHFTGMKGASLKEHLTLFYNAFCQQFEKTDPMTSWLEAFEKLRETIKRWDKGQKVVLFFDELPWIETRKSGFLKALDHFWNAYFSKMNHVILVVCGSAASWMIEKIVNNKGGLHNRLTALIRLEPFSLKETKQYLEKRKIRLSPKEIINIYMATGGVAKYLSYIEKGRSSAEVIQTLCFKKGAPLKNEYNVLYSSLFNNYQDHMLVVETLAQKRLGLTHTELLKMTKFSSGGRFSHLLEELKEAGFISFIPGFNKKKKEGKYFLSDEYSFFYLTWMKNSHQTLSSNYWLSKQGSASFAAWAGFAFETLCRKEIHQIIKALHIEVVAAEMVHWSGNQTKETTGAQIDLIIDRTDSSMNLIEIKFYNSELILSQNEAQKMLFRREKFREDTKTKKTLFNTLISTYGAKENAPYLEAFDNQITIDAFF